MQKSGQVWINGNFIPWDKASISIQTHALHYGLGIFEGIRLYKTDRGSAIFRLHDHLNRFYQSAQIAGMNLPFKAPELYDAILETLKLNKLQECYIRPLAFVAEGRMGLNSLGIPISVAIMVWPWGAYLGEEGLKHGIRVMISSYSRKFGHLKLSKAKITGNYVTSQLAKIEAIQQGYDEAILLDPEGTIAEGSGENIFIVKNHHFKTPPTTHILEGITRDTILVLAEKRGWTTSEENFTKEELYEADEAFFTGTAAELTPIREVDQKRIGSGDIGPVSKILQQDFKEIVLGKKNEFEEWLTFVNLSSKSIRASTLPNFI